MQHQIININPRNKKHQKATIEYKKGDVDARILFNEQNEMTLNTEIAILCKAVQELSAELESLKSVV